MNVEVEIVQFPETRVAVLEHRGAPALEHETALRLVRWRIENRLPPERHRNYGIHYTNPLTTPPSEHRVDFCVSVDVEVGSNPYGVVNKVIPTLRCAKARHLGDRSMNLAAVYLYESWLPHSGEQPGDFPMFFHYVNVGPQVRVEEMITDVYLPLR